MSIPPDAYVIIIGAMKAGTSSLFNMLAQHPSICSSRVKEPEFFSQHQEHRVDVDRYEDLFDYVPGTHTRCLEASTGYTKFPGEMDVPRRMKDYGLEPSFIYVVRDPFARVESEYNFAHLSRKPWRYENPLSVGAVQRSMYYLQIREFLRWYPERERYLIVDFDELVADPVGLAHRIFAWCGLDAFTVRNPTPRNVTPPASRIEQRLKALPALKRLLPTTVIARGKALLRTHDASAKRTLTDAERATLHEWLRRDLGRFGAAFGVDVGKWGFEGAVPSHEGPAPSHEGPSMSVGGAL